MSRPTRPWRHALTVVLFLSACSSEPPASQPTSDAGPTLDGGSLVEPAPEDASTDAGLLDDACVDCSTATCGNGILEGDEACDDGNDDDHDACKNDCTESTPGVVDCQRALEKPSTGVCTTVSGNADKLITGDILLPDQVLRGGQLLVSDAGIITCVACDCSAEPGASAATQITCPDGVVSPGLINPHDHITYAHNAPPTSTSERYEHRHDWRHGLREHSARQIIGNASNTQIRWAELRFVMGGATSTIGSGGTAGLLRNLDRTNQHEGTLSPAVELDNFPLGDSSGTLLTSSCAYPSITTAAAIADYAAYFPHIGEGIDAEARNELTCISSSEGDAEDLVEPQTALIGAIGLFASDYALLASEGTALVWSPRSNLTLYGDTAQVTSADRLGVLITLGTDWLPTGSMNLLRELRCAKSFSRDYLENHFSDRDLFRMVTLNAAMAAAVHDELGVLARGRWADISIFDAKGHSGYSAVVDADPADVALVMRAGQVLYGDDALVDALTSPDACSLLDVCTIPKRACLTNEIGQTFNELELAVGEAYSLFSCETPPNEPTCVPARGTSVNGANIYTGNRTEDDSDGDGIVDVMDNCKLVFNPIRPVDDGAQADADKDGLGDACDPCPLNPDTTACSSIDPDDEDGDGVPTAVDVCPDVADPAQQDSDGDGKGDACDACPNDPNLGPAPCPATI